MISIKQYECTSIFRYLNNLIWIWINDSEKSFFIILHCLWEDRYNYLTRLIIVVYAWPENYMPCDYCRDTKFCRLEKDWKRIIFRLKSQIKNFAFQFRVAYKLCFQCIDGFIPINLTHLNWANPLASHKLISEK